MAKHRPFTDRAGYTRHCWECKHARKGWTPVKDGYGKTLTAYGWCSDGTAIDKYDSPNNPCSVAGGCEHYER